MLVGVMGYVLIEDFSFSEAFYMTIITVSTVGFGEVHRLSSAGQWFTSFLIMGSFGTFAYGLSSLTQILISGELAREFKKRNLDKAIHKISGHVIICGFGRNGRRAYQKLKAYGQDVLIIEKDQKIIEQHLQDGNILFLEGDATDDVILEQAGISRARALVSTLSKDADNLFVIISARNLNKDIRLISRASSESTEKKLRMVGADSVVMPEGVGGGHMASLVVKPNTVEFLEHLSVEGSSAINLEEIELSKLIGTANSCSLDDLEIRQKTGCTVIGIRDPQGEYHINPAGNMILLAPSKLFVLGTADQIKSLNQLLENRTKLKN
jgi:voltage-gated potassium channel